MENHSNDSENSFLVVYIIKYLVPLINFIPARKAFREAAQIIYRALKGTLKPAYYLLGVDCGGGKSTFIKNIIRCWKAVGFKPDGGMIVALHTLKGVEEFAGSCGLAPSDYAVFTGDEKLNSFGRGRDGAGEAPVLFTTQQMVLARMQRAGSFRAVKEFHYKGQPRLARLWDESLSPAQGIVVPKDVLQALPGKLRRDFPTFVGIVDELLASIQGGAMRDALIIPTTIREAAAPIIAGFKDGTKLSKQEQEAVRSLSILVGRTVGIEQGMRREVALIGVGNILPDDFKPVIVFDASVRLRNTYTLMEEFQGDVIRLPGVEHSYTETVIHLCKTPMGTERLRDHSYRAKILASVAELINADPGSDYLVIHHMVKEDRFDIEGELKALLNNQRHAEFVHWGDHYGSNNYRRIRKVVVIGTWRKPEWVYAAAYMASSGLGYDEMKKERRAQFRLAEHSHDLMQAVGRSNIRNVEDGQAGQVEAYIFASPENGLEDRLRGIFPGCMIVPWEPVERAASGHLAAVIAYLHSTMVLGTVSVITKEAVRLAVGISTSQGLRNVTRSKRFQRFLDRGCIKIIRFKFVRAN